MPGIYHRNVRFPPETPRYGALTIWTLSVRPLWARKQTFGNRGNACSIMSANGQKLTSVDADYLDRQALN